MTYLGNASFPRRIFLSLLGLVRRPKAVATPSHPVWVIGHRGAARPAPENTLASFRKALDLEADAIETDVCVTRDGCFVLWHDAEPSESVALVRQLGAGRRTWGDFRHEVGRVVRARRRGSVSTVVAWTVSDEDRLRELVALGVDGIVTDEPALLRAIVGSV